MSIVFWTAQNEYVDPTTHCLVQGSEAFEHEREALREMGAPDTEFLIFHDIVPEDRDNAICKAEATPAFIQWLEDEDMLDSEGF